MNILISTTTNWNPGDDFIRFGVKNILKHIYPNANYIHYDRNPNNMIDWPHNQNMKYGLHGNFMNNPIMWEIIDLVVLAGSPEFLHHPLAPIYEGLVNNPHIPLLAIGVGYTEPNFVLPFTDAEKTILKRENTLVISRQQELSNRLQDELHIPIITLPCPALFCFEKFPAKVNNILDNYKGCHSLSQLEYYHYFSSDSLDMLNYIGECSVVISERLHAVIAGISGGAFCKLINKNFRTEEAIKLFEPVLQAEYPIIQEFKNKTLTNYLNILKNATKH